LPACSRKDEAATEFRLELGLTAARKQPNIEMFFAAYKWVARSRATQRRFLLRRTNNLLELLRTPSAVPSQSEKSVLKSCTMNLCAPGDLLRVGIKWWGMVHSKLTARSLRSHFVVLLTLALATSYSLHVR